MTPLSPDVPAAARSDADLFTPAATGNGSRYEFDRALFSAALAAAREEEQEVESPILEEEAAMPIASVLAMLGSAGRLAPQAEGAPAEQEATAPVMRVEGTAAPAALDPAAVELTRYIQQEAQRAAPAIPAEAQLEAQAQSELPQAQATQTQATETTTPGQIVKSAHADQTPTPLSLRAEQPSPTQAPPEASVQPQVRPVTNPIWAAAPLQAEHSAPGQAELAPIAQAQPELDAGAPLQAERPASLLDAQDRSPNALEIDSKSAPTELSTPEAERSPAHAPAARAVFTSPAPATPEAPFPTLSEAQSPAQGEAPAATRPVIQADASTRATPDAPAARPLFEATPETPAHAAQAPSSLAQPKQPAAPSPAPHAAAAQAGAQAQAAAPVQAQGAEAQAPTQPNAPAQAQAAVAPAQAQAAAATQPTARNVAASPKATVHRPEGAPAPAKLAAPTPTATAQPVEATAQPLEDTPATSLVEAETIPRHDHKRGPDQAVTASEKSELATEASRAQRAEKRQGANPAAPPQELTPAAPRAAAQADRAEPLEAPALLALEPKEGVHAASPQTSVELNSAQGASEAAPARANTAQIVAQLRQRLPNYSAQLNRHLSIQLTTEDGSAVRLTMNPTEQGTHEIALLVGSERLRRELKRVKPELEEAVAELPISVSDVAIDMDPQRGSANQPRGQTQGDSA